jgi:hypothetical protein
MKLVLDGCANNIPIDDQMFENVSSARVDLTHRLMGLPAG